MAVYELELYFEHLRRFFLSGHLLRFPIHGQEFLILILRANPCLHPNLQLFHSVYMATLVYFQFLEHFMQVFKIRSIELLCNYGRRQLFQLVGVALYELVIGVFN